MLIAKLGKQGQGSQLDLFHPPVRTPAWPTLPVEVRGRVETLLARLLRQHRLLSLSADPTMEVVDE